MSNQTKNPYISSALGALDYHETYVVFLPWVLETRWPEAPQDAIERIAVVSKEFLQTRLGSAIERRAPTYEGVSVNTLGKYLELLETADLSKKEDRQRLDEWYNQVRKN